MFKLFKRKNKSKEIDLSSIEKNNELEKIILKNKELTQEAGFEKKEVKSELRFENKEVLDEVRFENKEVQTESIKKEEFDTQSVKASFYEDEDNYTSTTSTSSFVEPQTEETNVETEENEFTTKVIKVNDDKQESFEEENIESDSTAEVANKKHGQIHRQIWVVYNHEARHWKIKVSGGKRASRVFVTKNEAIEAAKKLSKKNNLQVVIKNKDGKISKIQK